MKVLAEEELRAPHSISSALPPPEIQIDDRRKYIARIPFELQLRLTAVNYSGPARSINLSVTGLLLETCVPLTLGERVILTVTQPDGAAYFNLCAEVTRVAEETDPSKVGRFGLRILTDDSLTWHNFLRLLVLK
jgi:hypothetical protein